MFPLYNIFSPEYQYKLHCHYAFYH